MEANTCSHMDMLALPIFSRWIVIDNWLFKEHANTKAISSFA